jgi:3-oxoacyl-(acyl-carrier-protein) synthase
MARRVVVTGLGIVSPLGSTVASAWDGVCNGRSGIVTLTKLDTTGFPVHIGGEVVGFNAEEYMSPKDLRKFDPFVPFGFAAAFQAVKDSGIEVTEANAGDRALAGLANETLCFKATLPLSTNNTFQNTSTSVTFTFDAEQTANNP